MGCWTGLGSQMVGVEKRRAIPGETMTLGCGPGLSGREPGGALEQRTHGDPGKGALTGRRGVPKGRLEDARDFYQL